MAGVAFAVEGDGVGFATESYAASALYTTLASLSAALWRIRRANSVNWLGTVRGRIGIAAAPNFLIYGTGGLAYGGVNSNTGIHEAFSGADAAVLGLNSTSLASGNFSETRVGWTVGAGGEWMFTSNWSAKLEYLHYDLGSANYGTTVNSSVLGLPFTLGQSSSTNFRGDIVRVGLNYKFGGPVVTQY